MALQEEEAEAEGEHQGDYRFCCSAYASHLVFVGVLLLL